MSDAIVAVKKYSSRFMDTPAQETGLLWCQALQEKCLILTKRFRVNSVYRELRS
jgi:hypothetical protein